jgi:hypothetical protein
MLKKVTNIVTAVLDGIRESRKIRIYKDTFLVVQGDKIILLNVNWKLRMNVAIREV